MSVHFTLSDVDSELYQNKTRGESRFKPFSTHFLSKKKRVEDLYDVNNPSSNLLIAADTMIEEYTDKVKTVDALNAVLKKNTFELEEAKQKINKLEAMLAESSNKDLEDFEADKIPINDAKRDAAIAVLESKINMATEAIENGLDPKVWDVKRWKDNLARMKENFVLPPYFIGFGESQVPRRSATGVPFIKIFDIPSRREASSSKFKESVAPVNDPSDSEGSSGEEGI